MRSPTSSITQITPSIHRHNVHNLSDIAHNQDQRFARDIESKIVGPMSMKLFLEIFLPCGTRIPLLNDAKFSKVPDRPDRESDTLQQSEQRAEPEQHPRRHPHRNPQIIHGIKENNAKR